MYGGFVYYVNSYSAPTLPVISPHVVGDAAPRGSAWPSLIKNSTLVVMFGYDPLVNAKVLSGDGGPLDHELCDAAPGREDSRRVREPARRPTPTSS